MDVVQSRWSSSLEDACDSGDGDLGGDELPPPVGVVVVVEGVLLALSLQEEF